MWKGMTDHTNTMQEPATAQWGQSISDADFEKLKIGFEPQAMEDRWHITITDQSQSSNISIHLARSWTGIELYVLDVKPSDGDSNSGAKIEAITWEQNKSGIRISEEQAKKEVVILTRSILECEFEALPEYDRNDVWNHSAAHLDAK
jgi:hypothetical protein